MPPGYWCGQMRQVRLATFIQPFKIRLESPIHIGELNPRLFMVLESQQELGTEIAQ
jgi:hypothetical protein